ncbi:MAG: 16S rRNA methyltransferase [Tenericutes bacterium HGW-Tenericutes-4]|jgi:16S rRNA (guanine1207-N2)-methyltransferase|nr:MAG: 16S rRNA methyltransferase [Tenericutes bacterium HGW-Tenericutes-4]
MSHYFKDIEHIEEDYFLIKDYVNQKEYTFQSCNNVFSKEQIDYGTRVLLNTILKEYKSLNGRVLDMGCGYGAIGVVLADHYKNAHFVMSDITKTAVRLAKHNLYLNKIENAEVINSDLYESLTGEFDHIVTNPPIKVGKEVLLNLILGAKKHLKVGGHLILVIKKSHGKDSIKAQLENTFLNCDVLERDKGYYILRSEKLGE